MLAQKFLLFTFLLSLGVNNAAGHVRFQSSYPCVDGSKRCLSSGTRTVEGLEVYRSCWEWEYAKECRVPSKNDCGQFHHCYSNGTKKCLLKDFYGNCINRLLEFSCKKWERPIVRKDRVKTGFTEKEGDKSMICEGIPCLDGNCIDKSYETNGEMADSLSKLHMTSMMKGDDAYNLNLFAGDHLRCSKKPLNYENCCALCSKNKGWGNALGASCDAQEKKLAEKRAKNLCVYASKEVKKQGGVVVLTKHHYCCYANLLEKAIGQQGRAQLGRSFKGSGGADCRGFSESEIQRLNFEAMDFSEFVEEIKRTKLTKGNFKAPDLDDLTERVNSALQNNMGEGDMDDPEHPGNGRSGFNKNLKGWLNETSK